MLKNSLKPSYCDHLPVRVKTDPGFNRCHQNQAACCCYCLCYPHYPTQHKFDEYKDTYPLQIGTIYSRLICLAETDVVSVFIKNNSTGAISANLQSSPDGINFVDDPEITIAAGETAFLTPYHFSKYMRIAFVSNHANGNVVVWVQMQTK